MAQATSHLMSRIQGSVSGLTYRSQTGGGIYLNARSKPSSKVSNHSQRLKVAWGSASKIWASMSQLQRDHWQKLALSYPGSKGRPPSKDSDAGRRLCVASLATPISYGYLNPAAPLGSMVPPSNSELYKATTFYLEGTVNVNLRLVMEFTPNSACWMFTDLLGPYSKTRIALPRGFNSARNVKNELGVASYIYTYFPTLILNSRYFWRSKVYLKSTTYLVPLGTFYGNFNT